MESKNVIIETVEIKEEVKPVKKTMAQPKENIKQELLEKVTDIISSASLRLTKKMQSTFSMPIKEAKAMLNGILTEIKALDK